MASRARAPARRTAPARWAARSPAGAEPTALVAGAARGEQEPWRVLVARYGGLIGAVARRHGLGVHDQEEVALHRTR
jgi:hypothetical protein